jgi:hypothetical protein
MYKSQAAAYIDHKATVNGVIHTITGFSEQEGKLKNGESAPYMILTADESGNSMSLHPRKASALFSKGEVEGIHMLVAAVIEEELVAKTEELVVAPTETIHLPEVLEAAPIDEQAKADLLANALAILEAKKPAAEKKVSKKQKCIDVYNAVQADDTIAVGDKRKVTIATFMGEEIGLSKPGANTYFQSCKSGAYK